MLALPTDAALRGADRRARARRGAGATAARHGARAPRAARKLRAAVGLPERDGLLVRAVEPGSPADRAGCSAATCWPPRAAGALHGFDELFEALDAAGDALELTVVRGTEERVVDGTLQ